MLKVNAKPRTSFGRPSSASARRFHGDFFSLSAAPLPENGSARFTCVVPKRVAHTAVSRNLIKRRCREAVRGASVQSVGHLLFLRFQAKPDAVRATFADMERDIRALIAKLADKVQ